MLWHQAGRVDDTCHPYNTERVPYCVLLLYLPQTYAPAAFALLRQCFGVAGSYRAAMAPQWSWESIVVPTAGSASGSPISPSSSSTSGGDVFVSADGEYIIKIETQASIHFFMSFLAAYVKVSWVVTMEWDDRGAAVV